LKSNHESVPKLGEGGGGGRGSWGGSPKTRGNGNKDDILVGKMIDTVGAFGQRQKKQGKGKKVKVGECHKGETGFTSRKTAHYVFHKPNRITLAQNRAWGGGGQRIAEMLP